MAARNAGGVVGCSLESELGLSDLIFVAVGVLNGNKFRGGSRRFCMFFLAVLVGGFACGSDSTCGGGPEIWEDELGARGVSSAFIASASVDTPGLAEIGPSNGGRLDDLAEKKGCSCSLPGDS